MFLACECHWPQLSPSAPNTGTNNPKDSSPYVLAYECHWPMATRNFESRVRALPRQNVQPVGVPFKPRSRNAVLTPSGTGPRPPRIWRRLDDIATMVSHHSRRRCCCGSAAAAAAAHAAPIASARRAACCASEPAASKPPSVLSKLKIL